jgi:antitoxin component YwqK of YwqJK toxin-antitoxin module
MGFLKVYSKNGTANYKDDQLVGKFTTWFENGQVHEEQNWDNGKPIGKHITYHVLKVGEVQPQIAKSLSYDEGHLHGEQKAFYPNGNVLSIINYEHGVLDGKRAFYGSNRESMSEANFEEGKLVGKYFEFTPEGRQVYSVYRDNKLNGLYQVYFPENDIFGRVKAFEANYILGKIEGEAAEFNEAGSKISSTFYKEGKKEGIATVYSKDGRVLITAEFKNDNQHGPAYEYYPNGKIKRQVNFVNDLKQGQEITYNELGKVISSANYKDGELDGLKQEWNDKGILIFEADYKNGLRHGKFNKYYDNGKPSALMIYVHDKLEDKKVFDEKGIPLKPSSKKAQGEA